MSTLIKTDKGDQW